jgi:branched-chain amino acid transport system ATP-binding protein
MESENSGILLETRGIKKRFGGNVVLDGIDLKINKNEIHSIIGPNGAGKTTFFNLISGIHRPDAGEILLEGHRIDRLKQYQICRLGIARTFQNAKPFLSMTALENVISGLLFGPENITSIEYAKKEAIKILEFVDLNDKSDILAESLTIGDIRRLEIARAIAGKPKLILFDEVLAGLTVQEIEKALCFIHKLRDEKGVTILLVEHNLSVVMNISDIVTAINLGKIICSGKPEEVANNKCVIESYMGVEKNA